MLLRFSKFVALAVLVLVEATICFSQTKDDSSPAFNTVKYNDGAWVEYKPTGGRFSVLLPGMPAEQSQLIDSAFGKKTLYLSVLLVQIGESFAVCLTGYSDFPIAFTEQDAIRKVLDGGRDELFHAKSTRKLIAEKDIELDSHIGRELKFEDGNLLMVQRMFLIKERFYQVTVGVPKESKDELTEKLRQKILGSYKILAATNKDPK